MKKLYVRSTTHAAALLAALCVSSVAVAQTLPLRHGVYVLEGTPCKDAPNAALLVWDGKGFSGAHASSCTSQIAPLQHGRFQVSTSCAALGDGTPDAAGAASPDVMTLDHVSSAKFSVTKGTGVQLAYRWCSAQ